jgi:hypothetical protein
MLDTLNGFCKQAAIGPRTEGSKLPRLPGIGEGTRSSRTSDGLLAA